MIERILDSLIYILNMIICIAMLIKQDSSSNAFWYTLTIFHIWAASLVVKNDLKGD